MRAMIKDYQEQKDRYPSTEEFMEKLGISSSSARRYKRVILDEDRKKILDTFQDEIIIDVDNLSNTIKENIKIFKSIRDGLGEPSDRINAARNLQESHLDLIRIKRDAPEFLGLDYSNVQQSAEEHIHESEDRQLTEGITSLFD